MPANYLKFDIPREWVLLKAALEEGQSIEAGGPPLFMNKPCPFCGDPRRPSIEEDPLDKTLFIATCQCRAARGPLAITHGAALIFWDERRAPGDTAGFVALSDQLSGFKREPK